MSVVRLAVQEQLVPGNTLEIKFENAVEAGFEAIELRAAGTGGFVGRRREIIRARAAGVRFSSACLDLDHHLGSFEPERRARARADIKDILTVLAQDVGGDGLVVPNGCAVFSRYLPPFDPPIARATAADWLLEGLTDVGEWAEHEGVQVYLEPLNRYEDWVITTLGEATSMAAVVGLPSVAVCADTYHAELEERDVAAALRAAGRLLQHVQLGDSNRLEPGGGHADWPATMAALADIGYTGWLALECFMSGLGLEPLTEAARVIREAADAHSPQPTRDGVQS